MQVDLLYDPECPNVAHARANLLRGFATAGVEPHWREWRLGDPEAPRGYGSPTILVEGRDVTGAKPTAAANCCRLYTADETGSRGAPSVEAIAAALRGSAAISVSRGAHRGSGAWPRAVAVIPAVLTALLPKLACPACWPAYAGLLAALGLGFLIDTTVLLPLTAAFLALALVPLGLRARRRRGYRPLLLGFVAAAIVIGGKFWLERDALMYLGLGVLVAASLWNGWPRQAGAPACPACATQDAHATSSKRASHEGGSDEQSATIEVFSAGCGICEDTINLVNRVACPACEVTVLDMTDPAVAQRARGLGIRTVPTVVVDGVLAGCCSGVGPNEAALRTSGVGTPLG